MMIIHFSSSRVHNNEMLILLLLHYRSTLKYHNITLSEFRQSDSLSEFRPLHAWHQLSHLKATGLLTRCFLFSQAMWPNSHVPAGLAFAPASLLNCTL